MPSKRESSVVPNSVPNLDDQADSVPLDQDLSQHMDEEAVSNFLANV